MNYNEEKSWMKMYRNLAKSGDDHQWPSETLVRIMKLI
jgi:hypothetical protein